MSLSSCGVAIRPNPQSLRLPLKTVVRWQPAAFVCVTGCLHSCGPWCVDARLSHSRRAVCDPELDEPGNA